MVDRRRELVARSSPNATATTVFFSGQTFSLDIFKLQYHEIFVAYLTNIHILGCMIFLLCGAAQLTVGTQISTHTGPSREQVCKRTRTQNHLEGEQEYRTTQRESKNTEQLGERRRTRKSVNRHYSSLQQNFISS